MMNRTFPMLLCLVVFATSVFTATAAAGFSAYVSDNYVTVAQQLPFKAEYPIAREIKFVYADGSIVSGVGGNTSFLIATNLKTTEEVNERGIRYIKHKYPSVEEKHFANTSTLTNQVLQNSNLADQGRAALDKQNSGRSLTLNEAASTQTLGLATSIDNSISMLNASLATMDALSKWVKAEFEQDGYRLVDWIAGNTGAIGPSAPSGSVLHLDFIRVLQGKSFRFSSESEIIVSAILEQPGRDPVYSTRGIQMSIYGKGSPTPEQTKNKIIYKEGAVFLNKHPQLDPMKKVIYGKELAALANAAIVDIYRQLGDGI